MQDSDIRNGTVIITKWMPYYSAFLHAGIIVIEDGEIYVYDNDPDNPINKYGGSIKKTLLKDYLRERKILEFYQTDLNIEHIKKRADEIRNKPFSWLFFNCETLVRYVTGEEIRREYFHPYEKMVLALGFTAFAWSAFYTDSKK